MSNARNLARLLPDSSGKAPTTQIGAGSVIQVVNTTTTTQVFNNSTTYASTGLSLSITPKFATSKILVIASVPITFGNNGGFSKVGLRINRTGTVVWSNFTGNNIQYIVQQFTEVSTSYLDSPATTSATTYTIEFAELGSAARYGNTAVCVNDFTNTATLLLLEIAG